MYRNMAEEKGSEWISQKFAHLVPVALKHTKGTSFGLRVYSKRF